MKQLYIIARNMMNHTRAMKFFNNIPDSKYFVMMFVIAALLFGAFSLVLHRQFSIAQRSNEGAINNYETLRITRAIYMDVVNMETGVRGFLLTGSKSFLDPYVESKKKLDEDKRALQDALKSNEMVMAEITNIFEQIDGFNTMLEIQANLHQYKNKRQLSATMLDIQKKSMDRLRRTFDNFMGKQFLALQERLEESRKQERNFLYTLLLGTLLTVGAMFVAYTFVLTLVLRERKTQLELKESEDRMMTIINGVNDGIYDFDPAAQKIYYSPSYKAMLGYKDDELESSIEVFDRLVHPEDREQALETAKQYMERKTPTYTNIFRLKHKDGRYRWILSRGVGMWDHEGKIKRMVGTHTDITEHKNREEALKQLNSDLESFTYIASHDLRAPLVNLKGFAGEVEHTISDIQAPLHTVIQKASKEHKDQLTQAFEKDIPEALGFIKSSVEKMDQLTTAILNLSRIGKREHSFEMIDTNKVVADILKTLAFEITQKKVDVTYDKLPSIECDRQALDRIFSNLLENAVKYISPTRPGKIHLSAKLDGNEVVFAIADNGRGIAEEDKQKVFDIFRRARNTGDERGLGMGMAYVKASLRKLGGKIWFDSKLDEGTIFYFSLPTYIKGAVI